MNTSMAPAIREISLDIRTQARHLKSDVWDKMRAVRLAHSAGAVCEAISGTGWIEASGRAQDLALRVRHLVGKSPSPSEVDHLIMLAEGLADCLDGFLLAGLEESFLPADSGQWAFLLLGEGLSVTSPLFAKLSRAGFQVAAVARSDDLAGRAETLENRVVVVASADWLSINPVSFAQNRQGDEGVFVVALANEVSFMTRLTAQRAGANLLLDQTVTAEALVAALSGLAWPPRKAYRVMIVDDDAASLEFHAGLLRAAGMEVAALQDPVAVIDLLEDFEPEVLVIDIEMPVCRGTELVAMLRQRESRALLPVVYLSAYDSAGHLLEARRAGGEDYLVKPVPHDLFQVAVSTRARKYRLTRQINRERTQEREQSRRLREAADAHAIISVAAEDGSIVDVNEKFCNISGYGREELIGHSHHIINSGFHPAEFFSEMWSTIAAGRIWQGEIKDRSKDGRYYWFKSTIVPVPEAGGLPRQYISVRTDITEQKQLEESLLAAKEAAEAASRAKSEFLASMSHELRTPLNAILGLSQLFGMNPRLTEDTKNQALEIERAGQHLLSLVNDLIDLARIESGKLELSMEAVSVNDVLVDSLAMVAPLAHKQGIKLDETHCHCNLDQITVRADYVRLRQVLINLLANAIKYNRPQGKVRLSCSLGDSVIRISVADTGPGIPADKQARIFSAFDRLGAERGSIEGTGIGLVITKRIVEAMDGSIGFESAESQGSTFWVEFPVSVPGELPVQAAAVPTGAQETIVRQTGRPVVLYIEDNPMNLRLMQQIFAVRKDLELRDAHTAEIGIELARAEQPALILMDINLPGMDGYEALAVLKADPVTAHIPVFAITANAMKGDMERGMEAGFADYITKPINVPALLEMLDKEVKGLTP